ncbi:transcriptional regulator [Virgibacillus pantothenticus]|uniref:XRE family transcriptional regulator n=1 Tax=Virgibacillus pantothenticus TaxID=1473 RepID=A0A0L0QLV3_VIRPA|nr:MULTISPECIES: helix-turn-helix transcriptional regulator [Virgibacillus]API93326.1 transcriptional regulator [Virgibacillus sp. 6R]KNE19595.1 XRE family transcriptional regulator [Virgibacillus pantothenticus]MBS7428620.1 helix-turn-helix transcriptional regulator [Virgibacillus sp. 19R1-5]MBU8565851.1 helix-turn-helix transcriptional regulator [Virgibacillus pantothenticus]MBU8599563.1 helix-turn-helix transcriptional regulator [Virgibacillus pantothenticus]
MKLDNRVKELRARFNLTQEQLARKVGVTRQTIAAIEKGDYVPSLFLALNICRIFCLPMEETFWLQEEERDDENEIDLLD